MVLITTNSVTKYKRRRSPKRRSTLNYLRLREHHNSAIATINNGYIESRIVVETIARLRDSPKFVIDEITVPSKAGEATPITPSPHRINKLIQNMIMRREYEKSIVLLISIAEDYLLSYARLILRAYPERISISVKGNEGKVTVEFKELIEQGIDQNVETNIRSRLQAVAYASPAEYLNYINSILRRPMQESAVNKFVEAKASRDIIVHAQSVVNQKYLEKKPERWRALERENNCLSMKCILTPSLGR